MSNPTFAPTQNATTMFPSLAPTQDNPILGQNGIGVIVFFILGVSLGGLTEYFGRLVSFPIPYPVLIFFEGIGLAFIISFVLDDSALNGFETSTTLAPDLIVFVFLPILLFGEVKNLNWHHVKGGFTQALFLAGPGALFGAVVLAACFQGSYPGWGPYIYYVLGSILCATDPVSTVALLKSTGASSKLTIVIVGESLINDGAAMILYFFFAQIVTTGQFYTAESFFAFVAQKLIGSPAIGVGIGLMCIFISKKIYEDYNITDMSIQIIITLICGYTSFYLAEASNVLDGSGVLSVCGAGAMYSWLCSPKILTDHKMEEVWELLEWLANTLIFLLGGTIAGIAFQSIAPENYGYLVVLYILTQVIRVVMVAISHVIILRGTRRDSIFTSFAGIRGALAIALALSFRQDLAKMGMGQRQVGDEFYFFTAGIAGMTLLLNGTFAEPLLKYLQLVEDPLKPKSPEMTRILRNVKRAIRRQIKEEVLEMDTVMGKYDSADLSRVSRIMRASVDEDDGDAYQPTNRLVSSAVSPDVLAYVRSTFLETVRSHYHKSVMNGRIGTQSSAAQLLLYTVDKAMDRCVDPEKNMADLDTLEKNLKPRPTILKTAQWLDNFLECIGRDGYFVSYIDAWTERRALYTLSNFIDAHMFAQSHLHVFLGAPEKDSGNWLPEEACVITESENSVTRAKKLITLINKKYVEDFYSRRIARVALIRQKDIIEEMIENGALSPKWGKALLETIEDDNTRMDRDTQASHRLLLRNMVSDNREMRESFRDSLLNSDFMAPRPSLRESLQVPLSTGDDDTVTRGSMSAGRKPSVQLGKRSASASTTASVDGSV